MTSQTYTPSKERLQAFKLPEVGNVQISFSGGRTSGLMLWHILETNGGLPDRAKVVFTNTGREMPETLAYLAREHPDRFQWWIDLETRANKEFSQKRSGKLQSMRKLTLYENIKDFIDRQGDWVFDEEGLFCQADDGECTG